MATLKVEALPREFYFNGTRIPDPAPQMTAEESRPGAESSPGAE